MRAKTTALLEATEPEFTLKDLNLEDPTKPNYLPTQCDFLYDLTHRFQAYGGGLANGKTTAGVIKAFWLSVMFPGSCGYICRFDGKELKSTTLSEFRKHVPSHFFERTNDQIGYMKFKPQYGGSEIYYSDMKSEVLNNINLSWFWVDQAEEIDDIRWQALTSRLRRKVLLYGNDDLPLCNPHTGEPLYAPVFGFATFNPEGTASYLWRYFHPDSPEHNKCTCEASREGCLTHNYKLYQATSYDGQRAGFVTKGWLDSLLAVYPEEARKRYLDGSWDVFSGRIFPQFDKALHVLPSITVKPHWKIYESIDHGLTNPTAVGWWAIDELGNRFLIDEHYEGNGQPVKYHSEIIKNKRAQWKNPIAITYLDSACWANNQSKGDSVFSVRDEYADNGIFPVPGQKDWDTGYNRIVQGLNRDPLHKHPITGELNSPHIYVSANCTNFIKEALGYRWKKNRITAQKNSPDQPMDFNDHHMDEWTYFEASRPQSAVLEVATPRDLLKILAEQRLKYNPLADSTHEGASWMSH